jgi:O-antigen/teichoic acid export membrane protein
MLNALLVGLFFRADQFIIQANQSPLEVARYEAAYRFLNFVLIITPAVTLALFPRMSRHAASDRPRLAYEYGFALKVMMAIAIPIVGLTVWFAPLLISIVTGGKPGYLPSSAAALQILIFFLPFSFINGVTQYVLIALDRQRLITKAFLATVVFNVASNLVLVPALGINGAAIATILSELVLLGPFLWWTHRETGVRASLVLGTGVKPLLAGLVAAGAGWLLWPLFSGWESTANWAGLPLYLGVGLLLLAIYGVAVLLLRPFTGAEVATLRGALRRGRS